MACLGQTASEREALRQWERPDWADFNALEEHISIVLMTFPDVKDQRGYELPSPAPLDRDLLEDSSRPPDTPLNLDPENHASLDMETRVSPMIARALIETLHAAIVLYDAGAEPPTRGAGSSTSATIPYSDDAQGKYSNQEIQREHCYMRRLAAARAMAYLTRQMDDWSKIYVPMCIVVSPSSLLPSLSSHDLY